MGHLRFDDEETDVNVGRDTAEAAREVQRKGIKKAYAAAKRGQAKKGVERKAKAAVKKTAKPTAKAAAAAANRKKQFGIVLVLGLVLAFLLNFFSSCAVLMESIGTPVAASTYPSRDEDMLGAEAEYKAKEAKLRSYLENYESTHDYDEYHYDLDEIGHDPYVLISLLTAWKPGEWTLLEVTDIMQSLFNTQYTLTETVVTETRYDNDGEAYDYTICTVTLKNLGLDRLPVYFLTEEQLSMYALYMATLGNRPDLFGDSEYVGRYGEGSYTDYEIPPEALTDEVFAAMIAEAEKYLGYPYVWGGSSPDTSFDCSGFVCWVLNHSGFSVGRVTAQGLCNLSTLVSDPRPGDLVFFEGTYDSYETVTHVGIYVGDGWMIHAGDPISYFNFAASAYHQQHLFGYGRMSR